jgi:hypothetical protein
MLRVLVFDLHPDVRQAMDGNQENLTHVLGYNHIILVQVH